ncbi:hypothetical protein [Saccharopolyspora erythraea]|uniref:Uncharacterized protein n=2 Tax=Saccharopolyspora erythraea TaxID=1836 RepID=A4FCE2_SACEN|nr:hypothetical protein [Saccharopolyspora erythraea]EQD83912.1 hypothetical protein N599_22880 [Saccharopolyspora erythraea D]QRK92110.1 hypothetical protein JQX30_12605 [Saccharopolyspora erythraea]CAM01717.1 hypothetical protein SACE_2419 [Saccharopolyspora erythraea NRRL 2338]
MIQRTVGALRMPVTWQLAVLYALTFGGFVAFSVYLTTYLKTAVLAVAAVLSEGGFRPLRWRSSTWRVLRAGGMSRGAGGS